MRRVLRWGFNLAAAVLAALFLATCALWVESGSVKSHVSHEFKGMNYGISAREGKVFIWKGVVYDPRSRLVSQPTRWSATGPQFESVTFTPIAPNLFRGIRSAPQHYDFDSTGNLYLISIVAAPFWMIAFGLLLLPALVVCRFAYQRRKPKAASAPPAATTSEPRLPMPGMRRSSCQKERNMKPLFNVLSLLSLVVFFVSMALPFNGTYLFFGRMLIEYLFLWPFLLVMAVPELLWHRDTPLTQSMTLAFISPMPTINLILLAFLILRRKSAWMTLRLLSSAGACLSCVVAVEFGGATVPLCLWSASISLTSIAIRLKPVS